MNDDHDDALPKSKTQIKKEMIELQELGVKLTQLKQQQLQSLDLPSPLLAAVLEAKRLTSPSAKRRQMQYIGRLMRDIEEPGFIQQFFDKLEDKDQRAIAFHHMLEAWRTRLIKEDDALTEFIVQFPDTDRQYLRQLIQKSRKELEMSKSLGASKTLFRYIRELFDAKDQGVDS